MGLRKYKRQIAKARLTVMGVGNVNKKMKTKSSEGIPNWRKALYGESGKSAERAQLMDGLKRKQRDEAKKSIGKRKIRKVTA